ncbi:hypothetical protein [Alkalidesulfovibrio alkalitolerans]|uniref:hypothetical protein n=1 Tax=Alkalidesulfovibrio alkalitolerans TaxID=293256 RepID=UPI00058F7AB8|nr:hypothetical protein [Alkalidesulfovibrio alkalitolerans]
MSKTMTQQVAEFTKNEVVELFGGRVPTWDEYREAYEAGRVRADRSVAGRTYDAACMSKFGKAHARLTALVSLIALPSSLLAYFFWDKSGWWILCGLAISVFFGKVSREVQCECIKQGAYVDENVYEVLFDMGAFLFGPKK